MNRDRMENCRLLRLLVFARRESLGAPDRGHLLGGFLRSAVRGVRSVTAKKSVASFGLTQAPRGSTIDRAAGRIALSLPLAPGGGAPPRAFNPPGGSTLARLV